MLPIAAIPAIAQGILGLGQTIGGFFSKKKNKRPGYDIQSEHGTNISLAQGIKGLGMDRSSYVRQMNNINRNATAGLSSIRDRRGSATSSIVQQSNDALLSLEDQAAQIANRNKITGTQLEMGANAALAEEKQNKWNWEKAQPYIEKARRANETIDSGFKNIFGAGNNLASLGMMGAFKKNTNSGSGFSFAGKSDDPYSNINKDIFKRFGIRR